MKTIIILAFILLAAGCTRTVYLPSTTVETRHTAHAAADSVYRHDSIIVRMTADTVWVERYRHLYRDKLVRDSVYLRDSVAYPVRVEVVREVRHVPRFFRWTAVAAFVFAGLGIALIAARLRRTFGGFV